jgi:hypothetical protein
MVVLAGMLDVFRCKALGCSDASNAVGCDGYSDAGATDADSECLFRVRSVVKIFCEMASDADAKVDIVIFRFGAVVAAVDDFVPAGDEPRLECFFEFKAAVVCGEVDLHKALIQGPSFSGLVPTDFIII